MSYSDGWHADVPNVMYHREPAVSASQLNVFRRSPAHYLYSLSAPPKDQTPAMLFGSVVHSLLAGDYTKEYVISPDVNRRTKAGKAEWEDFVEQAEKDGLTPIMDSLGVEALQVANVVRLHPTVGEKKGGLLHSKSRSLLEYSGFFTEPTTGIACRIRPDLLSANKLVHVNWKVTANAHPINFPTHCWKFGYLHSVGFYEMGMLELEGHGCEHWLVAVEKEPPHAVIPYVIPQPVVDHMVEVVTGLIQQLDECQQANSWPGYEVHAMSDDGIIPSVVELWPPNWAARKAMLQETYDAEGAILL